MDASFSMPQARQTMRMRLVLILVSFAQSIFAYRYPVGNQAGWNTGVNYTEWTSGKTFFVGDSLYFQFLEGDHTVLQVDQAAFNTCQKTKTIAKYTKEDTTVQLGSTGMFFFMCDVANHCLEGQKLKVSVQLQLSPAPAPPPVLSPPPLNASPSSMKFKQHIITVVACSFFTSFVHRFLG